MGYLLICALVGSTALGNTVRKDRDIVYLDSIIYILRQSSRLSMSFEVKIWGSLLIKLSPWAIFFTCSIVTIMLLTESTDDAHSPALINSCHAIESLSQSVNEIIDLMIVEEADIDCSIFRIVLFFVDGYGFSVALEESSLSSVMTKILCLDMVNEFANKIAHRLRFHGASERRICHCIRFFNRQVSNQHLVCLEDYSAQHVFQDEVESRHIEIEQWYHLSKSQACDLSKIAGCFLLFNPLLDTFEPTSISSRRCWPDTFDMTDITRCLIDLVRNLTDADLVDMPKLPDPGSEM